MAIFSAILLILLGLFLIGVSVWVFIMQLRSEKNPVHEMVSLGVVCLSLIIGGVMTVGLGLAVL